MSDRVATPRRFSVVALSTAIALCLVGVRGPSVDAGDCDEPAALSTGDCNQNGVLDSCDLLPRNFGLVLDSAFDAGQSPRSVVTGDLDRDGKIDIAAGDYLSGAVSILWGGSGGFSAPESWPAAFYPESLVSGDFDADGHVDLAATSWYDDSIVILPGAGQRRFGPPLMRATGYRPSALAAFDADGDEDLDLAVGHPLLLRVLVNPGDGSFDFATGQVLDHGGHTILHADLDRDGDEDLLVTTDACGIEMCNRLLILLNDGGGSFATTRIGLPPQGGTWAEAAGDWNSDGIIDLVLGGSGLDGISVLLGQGDGTFAPGPSVTGVSGVHALSSQDLDLDGDIDLAISVRHLKYAWVGGRLKSHPGIRVLLNDGVGGSGEWLDLPQTSLVPISLHAADLDGDSDPDLVATQFRGSKESLFLYENEPQPTSRDCNSNGVPDECEASDRDEDCSANGVPAECEPDCNSNGAPDDCDIAMARSTDCNLNAVPDDCEAAPSFLLSFDGPEVAEGDGGAAVSVPLSVKLHSCNLAAGGPGVGGWMVLVRTSDGILAEPTTAGTAAAPEPEGFLRNGFESTFIFESESCGRGIGSAVALTLSTGDEVRLDPAGSPHEILRFRLEATLPVSGSRAALLEFPDFCGSLRGGPWGHPSTMVTLLGDAFSPAVLTKTVAFTPAQFRRGDGNTDGRVDISDAIRTFMYLFQGASEPRCLDAADANDDAAVNLSDGLHILNDFFRPGTAIPAPGPFACGVDPAVDGLGCESYDACGA